MAGRRALRVRALLPRLVSRCWRKSVISGASRGGRPVRQGGLPGGGQGEQFGGGLQVPVGVGGVGVPEIGGQQRQPGGGVTAVAVPGDQSRDRERVAKIVNSGAAAG